MKEININLIQEIGGSILHRYKSPFPLQENWHLLYNDHEYKVVQVNASVDNPDTLAVIIKFVK